MVLRVAATAAILAGALVACGPSPRPTSTSPLTPGSASIEPSPVGAESVPKSAPPPASSM